MVYLNLLLSSSNWADFHLADAAFTVPHREIPQNRFTQVPHSSLTRYSIRLQMNWQLWTKNRQDSLDADFIPDGEPPRLHNIKSDIIAFIAIFLGLKITVPLFNNQSIIQESSFSLLQFKITVDHRQNNSTLTHTKSFNSL